MTQPINLTFLATVNSAVALHSPGLDPDGTGFFVALKKQSTETIKLRLKGDGSANHALITGVRSVVTPDGGLGPWTDWTPQNGLFVLPGVLALGDTIRIEVDNSANAPTTPQGGGHFRVVEEGGGLVLASAPSAPAPPDSPRQRAHP